MSVATLSPSLTAAGPDRVSLGRLTLCLEEGGFRGLCLDGVEVLRRLSFPVRDADWRTLATEQEPAPLVPTTDGLTHSSSFRAEDGSFQGRYDLRVTCTGPRAELTAMVEIHALRPLAVNRAGFAVLHPLAGVVGTPMALRHPDGSTSQALFPVSISPGQTALNIQGMAHHIAPIDVDIDFDGEVFEMEDQRNWSDASFKTYCRPLARPRPFEILPGTPLRQMVTIRLAANARRTDLPTRPEPVEAVMPVVAMAHEPGLSRVDALLTDFADLPVLARLTEATRDQDIAALQGVTDLTLELVASDRAALAVLAQRCRALGLSPRFAVGLPQGYLSSHQPEGPWPAGHRPDDFQQALRILFPDAAIGAGSLTNFTELNRCRPQVGNFDFLTFGNTAIVHAADDLSVIETLEALPQLFASARALAGLAPLRLGLICIGMRSNPYGATVVDNPLGARMPMARLDPRQTTDFAAAYAVGVLAAAALGGVQSLALAMPDGPLGTTLSAPLGRVVQAASRLAGKPVTVTQGDHWVQIAGNGLALAANVGGPPVAVPGFGQIEGYTAHIGGEAAR